MSKLDRVKSWATAHPKLAAVIFGSLAVLLVIAGISGSMEDDTNGRPLSATETSSAAPQPNVPKTEDPEVVGYLAESMCEDYVRDQLPTADTAEFSNTFHKTVGSNRKWIVAGDVSAENLYGARVSGRYSCLMTTDANGESWKLRNIEVG